MGLRSASFAITLKRATQTDRHRIKLLSVPEEGKLLRKYEVSSARDWLGHGPLHCINWHNSKLHLRRFHEEPNGGDLQALDLGVRSRPWSQ